MSLRPRQIKAASVHGSTCLRYALSCLAALGLSFSAATLCAKATSLIGREPLAPLALVDGLDPEKVALGEALFADPILSNRDGLSCLQCHNLAHGGTVKLRKTMAYNGRLNRFNAPTIFNVAANYRLGWRGDSNSLEDHTERVLLDRDLMAASWPMLISRLRDSETYSSSFQRVYGRQVNRASVLDALATFQRSLTTPNSAFDKYLAGDNAALSAQEIAGYRLFTDYGCASCHQGSNIGGNMFQKFGIFARPRAEAMQTEDDLGRFMLTGKETDKEVFRVPSLRNVAVTGPYFHDGRTDSLSEAVGIMALAQLGRTLTPNDVDAIVAFLKTLTGEYHGHKLEAEK